MSTGRHRCSRTYRRYQRGWTLLQGEATALPLPDAYADAAACAYLFHLLEADELRVALAELRRVLRPGGRLVTVTPAVPRSPLAFPYAAAVERLAGAAPGLFGGLRAFDPAPALREGGFRLDRGAHVTHGYLSLCVLARRT